MLLSNELRKSLESATSAYEQNMNELASYLLGRGITKEAATAARLGFVSDPRPGHDEYRGRMAIPYLTRAGVVSMKFRCIKHDDCKAAGCVKYLGLHGVPPRLYNVNQFFAKSDVIGIVEGELDSLVNSALVGLPTVGAPGSSSWQPYWHRLFEGYSRVLVFTDGDDAGRKFGKEVLSGLQQGQLISLPPGDDVNSVFVREGAEGIRGRAGL